MKHAAWWILILLLALPGWAVDGEGGSFGQPFTREIPVTLPSGVLAADGTPFTVPAGKLLVIEFVSVSVQIESGAANNAFATLHTTLASLPHDHSILMTKQGSFGPDHFIASQPVRIYAQAGTQVGCTIGRNNFLGVTGAGVVTVTGRLVSD